MQNRACGEPEEGNLIGWTIFRKYESKDEEYYRIIKGRIVEEKPLFPWKQQSPVR